VLDLCAAPGSKTLQLLDAMHAPSSCATDCATGSSSSSTNTNHLYEKENSAEPSSSMSQQRPSGLLIANEIEAKRYVSN
jgi:16S rRNA C967 or C1407 C5-methylase (RsmB/RsmF family)